MYPSSTMILAARDPVFIGRILNGYWLHFAVARSGAVFYIEAFRLARNGRDWHMLLEFCQLVGTILIDEDGIYDPREPTDRLLLGMKSTLSEMELSTFRQRSQAALDQKAKRGE